jgi:hypothetical protein
MNDESKNEIISEFKNEEKMDVTWLYVNVNTM